MPMRSYGASRGSRDTTANVKQKSVIIEAPSAPAASSGQKEAHAIDTGLSALAAIAGYYGIPADPLQMAHELGLTGCFSGPEDLVRSAKRIGLKARLLRAQSIERLASAPLPAIIALSGSGFVVTAQRLPH